MSKKDNNTSLEEQVAVIQQGDETVQNHLLKTYQPFIAKSVSEVCKRYIDPKRDDEFSIGLMAFNEAIMAYSPDKGSSFLSFARLVVKRKVIDYIRHEQGRPTSFSIDENYDDEQMENPTEVAVAKEKYKLETEAWYRREEIYDMKEKLHDFKLSFEELAKHSPKHKDARSSAVKVARILLDDDELREYVYTKKKLPIKWLLDKVDVSKKTLERNRKFILAMFIVLSEDYIYLKDYLKGVGQ